MLAKVILTIIFLLTISSYAQQEIFSVQKKLSDPVYYKDFFNFVSNKSGQTKVDIFIQVPYKNVQFINLDKGLTAKYSVTVSIYDSSKSLLIVEKTWNETIVVDDYNIATSKDNYNLSKKSFYLKPGPYLIRTDLEDLDSHKKSTSENIFDVKDLSGEISLSDIIMATIPDTLTTNTIIPNISRNISSSKKGLRIYFEINSMDSVSKGMYVEYKVKDAENVIFQIEKKYDIKQGINQLVYDFPDTTFDLGAYSVSVTLIDDNLKSIASSSKTFYAQAKGLPTIITDIDKAIKQTMYIATPDEIDYMEEGKDQTEKTKRFLEFWKKKDPSPNNEENEIFDEYYGRVAYANANFSNYREGWISDRGMVLILLGVPNNVDRHPFEYDSKPYEIWEYYNLNKSFIFLDESGFGDYRLMTPLTGDLYRYRY